MSLPAVIFMLLTMGGVIGLNVLCLSIWLRGSKQGSSPAAPGDAEVDDA